MHLEKGKIQGLFVLDYSVRGGGRVKERKGVLQKPVVLPIFAGEAKPGR